MYRLHPSWIAVRELVAAGRIGTLRSVDSWFSYHNDDPANIRNIREVGGGALYDVGCYCVNLSRMLFGAEPVRVQSRVVRDDPASVDVLTSGILEFATGTATFTCSTRTESDQRVDIYGTSGRISIDIPFNIPPDRPTFVSLVSGGEPPVAPGIERLRFETADPVRVRGGGLRGGHPRRRAGPRAAGGRRREPARDRRPVRRGRLTPGPRTIAAPARRRPGRGPGQEQQRVDPPLAPDGRDQRGRGARRGRRRCRGRRRASPRARMPRTGRLGSSTRPRPPASTRPSRAAPTTRSTSVAAWRCSTATATAGPTSTSRAARHRPPCSATRARPAAASASRGPPAR